MKVGNGLALNLYLICRNVGIVMMFISLFRFEYELAVAYLLIVGLSYTTTKYLSQYLEAINLHK